MVVSVLCTPFVRRGNMSKFSIEDKVQIVLDGLTLRVRFKEQ